MQGPSGWGSEAESSFFRHLIDIGVRQKEFEDRKKRILEEAQIDEAVKQVRQEEDFEKQEMLNRIEKNIYRKKGREDDIEKEA
ncbi:MAG: hypothetical protein LBG57_05465 [Treponema sp.]|jgi:hypothetical protein|nr:hypothetical protein [Treponema sp.]